MKHDRGNSLVQTTRSVRTIRKEGERRFAELEWPGPSDEMWRRTDVSGIDFESFKPDSSEVQTELPRDGGFELETFNGGTGRQNLSGDAVSTLVFHASGSRDRVEAFHYSRINNGFTLRIPAGVHIEEPMVLRFAGGKPGTHEALFGRIMAEENSSAQVYIILEDADGSETLRTAGFHFEVGRGSRIKAAAIQDLSLNSKHFGFHSASIDRDGQFTFSEIDLGAALSVSAPVFSTLGEGAQVDITGLYAAARAQHKNLRPVQRHAEPYGSSNSLYKGALLPGGRTIFQGLIRVEPGAVRTDAYLSNKNLLLEDGARADSIPSLQILNNDVRCTHGSTTGKLNPEQVFYLQSRGFSSDEAKRLLLWSFYDDALGKLPELVAESVRERLLKHPIFSAGED
ncbi:SufD family Fe-S cluster assembly protein [Marispirochaeta aestuarii]|uniref:SufB/SufD family protein n=1 Tax=Marispirochaeta aestuarii TaxID=1963862 RepID=UPI002ABD1458|nr:SufD family Fe-S cluster assembly protein [Marispirochaeta aestuarii]